MQYTKRSDSGAKMPIKYIIPVRIFLTISEYVIVSFASYKTQYTNIVIHNAIGDA